MRQLGILGHPYFTVRRVLINSVFAALLGAGIAFVLGGADVQGLWLNLAGGCVIGLCINLLAVLFELLFYRRLENLSERTATLLRIPMFLLSATLGWLIGGGIVRVLFFGQPFLRQGGSGLFVSLAVSGGLGVVIGVVIFSYELLRHRLEDTIGQLKESEYAERELELARTIQQRLLPPASIQGDGYRIASRNLAARFVAGDFYDVFPLEDGSVGIVAADVAGKGMGASLIMASVKAVLPLMANGRTVEDTLRQLNRKLVVELGKREFVALAYVSYHPPSGTIRLANAGLPDPFLIARNSEVTPVVVSGPRLPLGSFKDVLYEAAEIVLAPGERFLLFSDGLPEAQTASGDQLGYEALADMLKAQEGDADVWLNAVFSALRVCTSPAIDDDWTAVLLERSPRLTAT